MPDPSIVRFRRVVTSAYAYLEERRQEVNDLNVFPVADGDTGYGNAMNVRRTVQEFARAGAAAILIEDQVWPKKCGHYGGARPVRSMNRVKDHGEPYGGDRPDG